MNYKISFDRLRLSVPAECVTVKDVGAFTTTVSGSGIPIRAKYEQMSPFYYSVIVDYSKNTTDIEFSGKALLDDYPALINSTNITTCFDNINRYGVCSIDSQQAVYTAYVKQCDVTYDIRSSCSIRELYNNTNLSSSKSWCIRDITSNRFTIESTNTTKRFKSRLIVYDKEEEMSRKPNQSFLSAISNVEEQLEHFRGKIRFELNLNSINRIRHYLNVEDTKLSTLLYSNVDPIAKFLGEAIRDDSPLQQATELSHTLRELEHLLLLAICDYDLNKVELLIRSLYGASRSVKRCKEPYASLLVRLQEIIPEPQSNAICCNIASHLKSMLSLLTDSAPLDTPNLRRMYTAKHTTSQTMPCQSTDVALFNIDHIQLPV